MSKIKKLLISAVTVSCLLFNLQAYASIPSSYQGYYDLDYINSWGHIIYIGSSPANCTVIDVNSNDLGRFSGVPDAVDLNSGYYDGYNSMLSFAKYTQLTSSGTIHQTITIGGIMYCEYYHYTSLFNKNYRQIQENNINYRQYS